MPLPSFYPLPSAANVTSKIHIVHQLRSCKCDKLPLRVKLQSFDSTPSLCDLPATLSLDTNCPRFFSSYIAKVVQNEYRTCDNMHIVAVVKLLLQFQSKFTALQTSSTF